MWNLLEIFFPASEIFACIALGNLFIICPSFNRLQSYSWKPQTKTCERSTRAQLRQEKRFVAFPVWETSCHEGADRRTKGRGGKGEREKTRSPKIAVMATRANKNWNAVFFFRDGQNSKTRYSPLGFDDKAHLPEGNYMAKKRLRTEGVKCCIRSKNWALVEKGPELKSSLEIIFQARLWAVDFGNHQTILWAALSWAVMQRRSVLAVYSCVLWEILHTEKARLDSRQL